MKFYDHLMPQGPSSAWHPGGTRKHLWNESEWEVLRIVQVWRGEGLAGNASEVANWVERGQGARQQEESGPPKDKFGRGGGLRTYEPGIPT